MDPQDEIREGARNAVRVCMDVGPADRVWVLTDEGTRAIGELLAEEAAAVASQVSLRTLEEYGPRPITEMPESLERDLREAAPTVGFYACESKQGEIGFRVQLRPIATDELKMRWAHMVSIEPRLMREGMRADYHQVAELTRQVHARVSGAQEIKVRSPHGTEVAATFSPDWRWIPSHGLYHRPGEWGNLPDGETYTTPANLEGTIVAQVLGDYFSPKYGVLDDPVTLLVEAGWITDVACKDRGLAQELWSYLNQHPNGRRAAEFAIGTNTAVRGLSGNLLQDEKIPGVHIAFGYPYPDTGADWSADTHVDVIPVDVSITVDGELLFEQGRFRAEVLRAPGRES
ncbi:MAG: aminopeptidase [Anaerolineae bacterium]